jgi:hypothetical protein
MERMNVLELGRIVRSVEEARQLRFTPTASAMLYSMVDAVTRDPHPSWRTEMDFAGPALDSFQKDMIGRLQGRLMEMPVNNKNGMISTFDLLHAVSSIIDAICPFSKVPR